MAMTPREYAHQLAALLPKGEIWNRDNNSNLMTLLLGLAQEFARVDRRAIAVIRESDPRTTLEMLPDWERNWGLPDDCLADVEQTNAERRDALVAKIVGTGGQSRAYFIEVAAALGYEITIEEFRPFRAGMSCAGDRLTNGDWQFTWRVHAPPVTVRAFRAGSGAAGEPLRTWGNVALECKLNQFSPAHTILQFAYGE